MHLPGLIACEGFDLGDAFFWVIFFLVIFLVLVFLDDLAAGLTGWIPVGSGAWYSCLEAHFAGPWSRDTS